MSNLAIVHLRCEHQENPLGIDVSRPRLGWQLQSERRGARQAAYRVTAAASPDALAGGDLLWDSGRVESDESAYVPYGGPPPASGQRVCWQVTVWDDSGAQATSAPAWWEMGLLERDAWQAQWVGGMLAGGPHTTSPAPFLRTSFTVERPVARARKSVV